MQTLCLLLYMHVLQKAFRLLSVEWVPVNIIPAVHPKICGIFYNTGAYTVYTPGVYTVYTNVYCELDSAQCSLFS